MSIQTLDIQFILCDLIQYYLTLLDKFLQLRLLEAFLLAPVPLCYIFINLLSLVFFFFLGVCVCVYFLSSLYYHKVHVHLICLWPLSQNQQFLQRLLIPFITECYQKPNLLVGVLIATGITSLLGFASLQRMKIHVHMLIVTSIHIYIIAICIHVKLEMSLH